MLSLTSTDTVRARQTIRNAVSLTVLVHLHNVFIDHSFIEHTEDSHQHYTHLHRRKNSGFLVNMELVSSLPVDTCSMT